MLSDLLRLSDYDIERAFQLCHAILVNEEIATRATFLSISALGVEADEERSRLRRLVKQVFSRKVKPEEIGVNYQYLLQRMVYQKTKHFEKTQEQNKSERVRIHEDTWLLRYLKHIVSYSTDTTAHATTAYCRVIHDYSREMSQRVHEFLVQRNPYETKGPEEFSKWKTRIDKELKKRFTDLLEEKREKGNVLRFIKREDAAEKIEYVIQCLKLFKPWGTSCLLPVKLSEFSQLDFLRCDNNDPVKARRVEYRRISTLLDYDCFSRLMTVFDPSVPREHFLIPRFLLPVNGTDTTPPANLARLPELHPQNLNKIRTELAEQSVRREKLMPRWLRIIIDGGVRLDRCDLHTRRDWNITLKEPVNLIEVYALDSDIHVPFACKTLTWFRPTSPKTLSFFTRLEGGQKVSFKISHSMGLDGDIIPSAVKIRYRETSWAKALAFHLKGPRDITTFPWMRRTRDTISTFMLDAARPINITLHVFTTLMTMILLVGVFFGGRYALDRWQASNIAKTHAPPECVRSFARRHTSQ